MKAVRWMIVFGLMATLAATAGVRLGGPPATAQDFQIIDRDEGTVEPRLIEPPQGPFPGGPMPQQGPMMAPAAALWGDETHLYVLRGDRVFKIEKQSMRLVGETRLPADRGLPMIREAEPRTKVEFDVGGGDRPRGDEPRD